MELKDLLLERMGEQNTEKLAAFFKTYYAIDIALAIQEFNEKQLKLLIQILGTKEMALVIEEADEMLQKRIVVLMDTTQIAEVFSFMSTDDIADILGILSVGKRKQLLQMMRESDSKDVQSLLDYPSDTAGGIMTTQYIALRNDLRIRDAFQKIKEIGPKTEVIETLFVVNSSNELIGTADLRDILIAPEDSKLKEIMNKNVISVSPETDQEEVWLIVSKYDLKALPVINRNNVIIGIITLDDVIDVIVEEQTEDLLMLSGVSKDERVDNKLSTSIGRRLPWLFINLVTAFAAAFTVGLFEEVIVQVVALAAVMPIVAGMGGNAGSQALSIVIRSIALGEVNLRDDWKLVFKEVALGMINGLATGFVTGMIIFIKYDNLFLGIIIWVAMVANLMIAGCFGFLIPMILKKINLDPAISSSIFLTTATDVCGFFIFLGLAKVFLVRLI